MHTAVHDAAILLVIASWLFLWTYALIRLADALSRKER